MAPKGVGPPEVTLGKVPCPAMGLIKSAPSILLTQSWESMCQALQLNLEDVICQSRVLCSLLSGFCGSASWHVCDTQCCCWSSVLVLGRIILSFQCLLFFSSHCSEKGRDKILSLCEIPISHFEQERWTFMMMYSIPLTLFWCLCYVYTMKTPPFMNCSLIKIAKHSNIENRKRQGLHFCHKNIACCKENKYVICLSFSWLLQENDWY